MEDKGTLILKGILDDLNKMSDDEFRKMLEEQDEIIEKEMAAFDKRETEIVFKSDTDKKYIVKDRGTFTRKGYKTKSK